MKETSFLMPNYSEYCKKLIREYIKGLYSYISVDLDNTQPSKSNYGIYPKPCIYIKNL